MPKPLLNSQFVEYEFSEEELKNLPGFTLDQRQFLQSELAAVVSEKVALTFDPEHPQRFLQQEAELQGKMGMLKYLLSLNPKQQLEI